MVENIYNEIIKSTRSSLCGFQYKCIHFFTTIAALLTIFNYAFDLITNSLSISMPITETNRFIMPFDFYRIYSYYLIEICGCVAIGLIICVYIKLCYISQRLHESFGPGAKSKYFCDCLPIAFNKELEEIIPYKFSDFANAVKNIEPTDRGKYTQYDYGIPWFSLAWKKYKTPLIICLIIMISAQMQDFKLNRLAVEIINNSNIVYGSGHSKPYTDEEFFIINTNKLEIARRYLHKFDLYYDAYEKSFIRINRYKEILDQLNVKPSIFKCISANFEKKEEVIERVIHHNYGGVRLTDKEVEENKKLLEKRNKGE